MHILTLKDAKAGFKQALDEVCRDHEPIVIVRKRSQHVVLLPLSDFNSINETLYLLGTSSNASRLRKSIEQHKSGAARPRLNSREVHKAK